MTDSTNKIEDETLELELPTVLLVFGENEYGESDNVENVHSMGTQKNLLGVAVDDISAAEMIMMDHFATIESAGLNPLHFPITPNEDKTEFTARVDGSRESTVFSNNLKWYTKEVPLNAVLDDIEL
jgi:hypothetical protein